jgi:hypothetical protein
MKLFLGQQRQVCAFDVRNFAKRIKIIERHRGVANKCEEAREEARAGAFHGLLIIGQKYEQLANKLVQ